LLHCSDFSGRAQTWARSRQKRTRKENKDTNLVTLLKRQTKQGTQLRMSTWRL